MAHKLLFCFALIGLASPALASVSPSSICPGDDDDPKSVICPGGDDDPKSAICPRDDDDPKS